MKKTSQQNSQIWYMLLWFGGITILTLIDQLTKHLAVKYLEGDIRNHTDSGRS